MTLVHRDAHGLAQSGLRGATRRPEPRFRHTHTRNGIKIPSFSVELALQVELTLQVELARPVQPVDQGEAAVRSDESLGISSNGPWILSFRPGVPAEAGDGDHGADGAPREQDAEVAPVQAGVPGERAQERLVEGPNGQRAGDAVQQI